MQNTKQYHVEAYRHLNNLAFLGLQEKLNYELKRVRGKIRGIVRDVLLRKAKIIVCNIYLCFGHRVPFNLRKFYFLEAHRQSVRKYVPQDYPSNLILLLREKRTDNCLFDWEELVAGRLELHELPGKHLDVIRGPHVQVWSNKLRNCLDKAQKTTSGKQT